MELTNKQLTKIAEMIRDQLKLLKQHRYREVQQMITKVSNHQTQLELIRQGLTRSLSKHWNTATRKLSANVIQIVHDLPYAIAELERAVRNCDLKLPTLRQVYEDLQQVQAEFGRLEYSQEENYLAVFTEPIELEDIFLGDFEIHLLLPKLAEMSNGHYLRVVALDPHPAATNDSVTHPHVSDEYLCAGDANTAIIQALSTGRICDAFMLIRSVLQTYNSSSPYVPLDQWEGISCYECGYVVSGDEVYYCEGCDRDFCGDCFGYCSSCHTSMCQGCLTTCSVCDEERCESCMSSCSECGESMCLSCLEDGVCSSCKEESEADNENENIESEQHVA